MTVWRKQGVEGDLQVMARKALGVLHDTVYRRKGEDVFVTSIRDGNHMAGSLHYDGWAFDIRHPMHGSEVENRRNAQLALNERFGQHKFDVVLEHDHLHVEYDPK